MHMSKSFLIISMGFVAVSVQAQTLTRDNGAPVGDNQNSITAGEHGSVLLQDVHLIQKLQRFARERIPERVVHARGTGAHGEFVASGDFSDLTLSAPFTSKGKITPGICAFFNGDSLKRFARNAARSARFCDQILYRTRQLGFGREQPACVLHS